MANKITDKQIKKEAAKAAASRSKSSKNRLVVFSHFCMSLATFGTLVALGVAIYGKSEFESPGPANADTVVTIPSGSSLGGISERLVSRGLISNALIFKTGVRAYGNDQKMRAGEYRVARGASMQDIMDEIVSGQAVEYSVTIPEGLSVLQAWRRIEANPHLVGDMPDVMPAEGMIAADTKNFPKGTERALIVKRLIDIQKERIAEIWANRADNLPLNDVNEFITLASIVEKETGIGAERPHVASVFINRLRKGMKIQSDPTIIYGIFGGEGKPSDRPIYKSDIKKPTPYNTYVIKRLPPGPIAIPGKAALEAVANPADTEDIFFVADGTGGHAFAKTLDEHNANVRRWREIEAERKAAAEAKAEQQ